MEEYLLSRSPNKVFVTVYASDGTVLIFTISIRFQRGSGFHLYHDLSPRVRLNLETNNSAGGIRNQAPKQDTLLIGPPMRLGSSRRAAAMWPIGI